jgi:hypothetical protein
MELQWRGSMKELLLRVWNLEKCLVLIIAPGTFIVPKMSGSRIDAT